MEKELWKPSDRRKSDSEMSRFIRELNEKKHNISNYNELWKWSVSKDKSEDHFWRELAEFYDLKYEGDLSPCYEEKTFLKYNWFPNTRLNFAENLLKNGEGDATAIEFLHESGLHAKITYAELRQSVASLQAELSPHIQAGDVVAAYMPNLPETVIAMLATTGLGGVFTSTSSDFGAQGVIDRFGQTRPKVLITVNQYQYGGKKVSLESNLEKIISSLDSLEKVIVVDFLENGPIVPNSRKWSDIPAVNDSPTFVLRQFSDPLYIMYSSGTTGKPKCIVHSIGGTLLQHIKELGLHTDLKKEKSIFYFTTCGWMMWNWLVSSLYFGSRVVLYEGSPAYPNLDEFIQIIDKLKIHIFGTSPKFLSALEASGYQNSTGFESLETILSTGAPLNPEQFDYVYNSLKSDVMLASIAGGTDIIGCFMLGNPLLPVRRGEITCRGLGMDVAVFNEKGEGVLDEEGELVCLQSFPSQPIYFWDDEDNKKYRASYFEKYENIWCHGDYVRLSQEGTIRVFGRSDATLNPGGVRIGTSEIYGVVEGFEEIKDCLCVGQNHEGDVRILLFVVSEEKLNEELILRLKTEIRAKLTPRHVPKCIYEVDGIPYTRSGKKMETAVTKIVNGKTLNNLEAVSNPECLDQYSQFKSKSAD